MICRLYACPATSLVPLDQSPVFPSTYIQDNISPAILKKIKPYVENPNMAIDVVTKVSKAASGLCMFVHAMDVYSKASGRDETVEVH